jgi:hypothetical protein
MKETLEGCSTFPDGPERRGRPLSQHVEAQVDENITVVANIHAGRVRHDVHDCR